MSCLRHQSKHSRGVNSFMVLTSTAAPPVWVAYPVLQAEQPGLHDGGQKMPTAANKLTQGSGGRQAGVEWGRMGR